VDCAQLLLGGVAGSGLHRAGVAGQARGSARRVHRAGLGEPDAARARLPARLGPSLLDAHAAARGAVHHRPGSHGRRLWARRPEYRLEVRSAQTGAGCARVCGHALVLQGTHGGAGGRQRPDPLSAGAPMRRSGRGVCLRCPVRQFRFPAHTPAARDDGVPAAVLHLPDAVVRRVLPAGKPEGVPWRG